MKIKSIKLNSYKRFTDLLIKDIPETAKLVILLGPNGCGKSSILDAFTYWSNFPKFSNHFLDTSYHLKINELELKDFDPSLNKQLVIDFYDNSIQRDRSDKAKKVFYIRSSYRNDPEFITNAFSKKRRIIDDELQPHKMIYNDQRVSDNYSRIVSELLSDFFDVDKEGMIVKVLRDEKIVKINKSLKNIFPDLELTSIGKPLENGTFYFTKGKTENFMFQNLSGGEKAVFDILLDLIIKMKEFDDTIFCIDEPELHMHSQLQSKLIKELFKLIPCNCQLWIATHSIGILNEAQKIFNNNPDDIVFLDFNDKDFDGLVVMSPIIPSKQFWRENFKVAIGDIADLIAPKNIIFCEGRRKEQGAKKNTLFDAKCYNKIFATEFSDYQFVSIGGNTEVEKNAELLIPIINEIIPNVHHFKLFDLDDCNSDEVKEIIESDDRILSLRDIENYLWDDEIIKRLYTHYNQADKIDCVLAYKNNLLAELINKYKPKDDIKQISGELYHHIKNDLVLTQRGSDHHSFAISEMVPLISPETEIYKKLKKDIFG
ncbi:MAG: ATP-binding protein [bacterium]